MNVDSAELACSYTSVRAILLRSIFEPLLRCRQRGLFPLAFHACIHRQVKQSKVHATSARLQPALHRPAGGEEGGPGVKYSDTQTSRNTTPTAHRSIEHDP